MSERESTYTADDYRHGTPPRVFGSETETNTNLFATDRLIDLFDLDVARGNGYHEHPQLHLTDFVPSGYLISHGRDVMRSAVLSTGGELYIDRMHLGNELAPTFESATAECLTPEELARHEHANLRILVETLGNLAVALNMPAPEIYKRGGYARVETKSGELLLKETSLGHHENYYTLGSLTGDNLYKSPLPLMNKETAGLFGALVLRKLIDGTGMVAHGRYLISQKPYAYEFEPYNDSLDLMGHGNKVPAAAAKHRIEIRTGEGNRLNWAIEQKIALTSLLLRYLDHKSFPEELVLPYPNDAIVAISHDPWADVELASGERRPAPDVLRDIIHRAREEAEKRGELPYYESEAVETYDAFYRDLKNTSFKDGDVRAIAGKVDWAEKLQYFYDRGLRHGDITSEDLNQVAIDLKFNRISDRRPLGKHAPSVLSAAIPHPPETRAKRRTRVARDLRKREMLDKLEWESITLKGRDLPSYIFNDPFENRDATKAHGLNTNDPAA